MNDFSDMFIEQCIPQALQNIQDVLLTIWNGNCTFYIAFALFFLIGSFLLNKVKETPPPLLIHLPRLLMGQGNFLILILQSAVLLMEN